MATRKKTEEPTAKTTKTPRDEREHRLHQMREVAKQIDGYRPARQVLTRVRAVPTIFPQYDEATRVGGHPIERIALVHGPSNHGKTEWALGLGLSFLQRDHYFRFVDAERTTPITWVDKLFGDYADHPGFDAIRPTTYEKVVSGTRDYLHKIATARETKKLPKDTTALLVVDSIRKLVPAKLFDRIVKETKKDEGGVDGFRGRAAQIKALFNSGWMDELVPLLEVTQAGLIFIARETKDGEAKDWVKKAGEDFKVGGGSAVYYDSSIVVRVERASFVQPEKKKSEDGEEDRSKRPVWGERVRLTIHKTKVAGKDDKKSIAHFHTSNGMLPGVPWGFDRPRDVLEIAVKHGVVQKKGTWLQFDRKKWQGDITAIRAMHKDVGILADMESRTRAHFKKDHEEVDEDGVVT